MWWALTAAWAGCCGGAGATVPAFVDREHRLILGADLSAEASILRWDAAGRVSATAWRQDRIVPRAFVGARWGPVQLGVGVPVVILHRQTADEGAWGGGLGDARVTMSLDPWEPAGAWTPVVSVGVRLPTGLDPAASRRPLEVDVTGARPAAAQLAARFEGTGARVWRVGAEVEVAPGATTAVAAELSAAVGRRVGTWTLAGTLRHAEGWVDARQAAARTAATRLGGLAAVDAVDGGRAWVDLGLDLPIPGLGAEGPVSVAVGGGLAWRW